MHQYGIVYSISVGRERRSIIEALIVDVPDGTNIAEVTERLSESSFAPAYSEHGFFMGNRKIVPIDKAPKNAHSDNAKTIEWKQLQGTESVQMNIRVPARDRASWELAAARAGVELRTWVRQTLNGAAGGP